MNYLINDEQGIIENTEKDKNKLRDLLIPPKSNYLKKSFDKKLSNVS